MAGAALDVLALHVAYGGVVIDGGANSYMEVTDTTDRMVWMCLSAVSHADYDALSVEAPLVKSGIGKASMDCAAFRHSPSHGEVRERIIDGRRFINVARPLSIEPPTVPSAPLKVVVDKAHVLGFDAGRTITILNEPRGAFVEMAGGADDDEGRVLPPDASLSTITLVEPWIVELPEPAHTWFWMTPSVRSFQGPVTLPAGVLPNIDRA